MSIEALRPAITWHNEVRDLRELTPHPKNPRIATKRGVESLEKSIERSGDFDTIAANLDGTILSGHRRRELYIQRGDFFKEVRLPDRLLTDEEAEAILIEANKAIAGDWDFDILANQFDIPDLVEFGFEPEELGIEGEAGKERERRPWAFAVTDEEREVIRQALDKADGKYLGEKLAGICAEFGTN